MKIKLNVSKDLKRDLKTKGKEKELDRNDFIYEVINNYLEAEKSLWSSEIEEVLESVSSEEVDNELIARENMPKTIKKQQPIVINVDLKTYYALDLIAISKEATKENLVIQQLKNAVR